MRIANDARAAITNDREGPRRRITGGTYLPVDPDPLFVSRPPRQPTSDFSGRRPE
jgi:hypothetical protein